MSQVFIRGTLIPISKFVPNETNEEIAYRIIRARRAKSFKLPKGFDSFVQLLEHELLEEYVIIEDIIYAIFEEEIEEMYEGRNVGSGKIEYTVKYNDNAMSHPDAIREAVDTRS